MPVQQLRVGVIGLGAFGESHIQAYQSLPHVEVVAVASRTRERARDIATQYSIPQWYEGYDALLANPSIEAVSITTAESDHREPAVAALETGKHVLVEKPLAANLPDARAIIEAAKQSSGILMPGHLLRFEPKYAGLKAAVDSGQLGALVAMSAKRNRPRRLQAPYSRVHPALVTAIHDLDVMLWLTGDRPHTVRAMHRLAHRDAGAHGLWGIMEFESGAVGTIETAWMLPDAAGFDTDDAFEAIGSTGTARIQFDVSAFRIWNTAGLHVPDLSYEPRMHGKVVGALKEELSYFAQCARAGQPPVIVTAADGLNALTVVLSLIESAERKTDVAIPWLATERANPR